MGQNLAMLIVQIDEIRCSLKADASALAEVLNPEPGKKSLYRMDTSLCVATEEMTWEEKQDEIQFNLHEEPGTLCKCHNILHANCPNNLPGATARPM